MKRSPSKFDPLRHVKDKPAPKGHRVIFNGRGGWISCKPGAGVVEVGMKCPGCGQVCVMDRRDG